MQPDLNQPLRGTTRSHLTGRPSAPRGNAGRGGKSDKSVDMLAARVTALFAPYLRDICDTEFLELTNRLNKLLSDAKASPFCKRRKP